MKARKTILVSLFLALMILAGCGSFGSKKGEPPVSAEFVATGTEGLVMQFVPDQPPAKVYTGAPLSFLFEVRNRGTYQVPSAAFYLTGYDPNIVQVSPPTHIMAQPLDGKTPFNPEGGYMTIPFEAQNVLLQNNMPSYKPTFMLTACYQYQTIATPLVCIDANPLDTTTDKACRVQKVYATGSQGAPVAVQSIEAEARPNGMYFRIHIGNSAGEGSGSSTATAGGTVFNMNSMASCPANLQYRDLNFLTYQASISQQPLDCEPATHEIRLVNNQATIFCKYLNIPNMAAYQTPLEVKLFYGYKSSISKMVEIENLAFGR
jgi:hypothetical protein